MGDYLLQRQNRKRCKIARWHVDRLVKKQNEIRKAEESYDCTLEIKEWKVKLSMQVNYAVVSAASEYCRSNSEYYNGKRTVVVDWKSWLFMIKIYMLFDVKLVKEALEQCIEFMYIGETEITDDTAGWIAALSHILKLKPLEYKSLKTMHENLTTCKNCHRLLWVARYCEKREYEAEAIKKWISLNLQQIPGLSECTPENLWWSAADLFQNSIDFQCICQMLDVLKLIEIEKADCKFLLDIVMTTEEVTEDFVTAKNIFEAICQKINKEPSNLNCRNYYKVKNLLAKYGNDVMTKNDLEITLKKFMINNFDVLAKQDGFLETNQDEVTSILSSPQLTCTEEVKFDSMMKWVKHRLQRAETLPDFFKLIKLQNLSENALINARKNPLVENNPALVLSVFDALANKRKTSAVTQPQHLPMHPDTARWVLNQRPEVDNSSNASLRSRRSISSQSSSSKISNFSTASLRESLLSMPTTTDSGANVDGDKADCSLDDEI